jgi:hypothetical protein
MLRFYFFPSSRCTIVGDTDQSLECYYIDASSLRLHKLCSVFNHTFTDSAVSSTIPAQILQCPQPYLHRFCSVLNHTFTDSAVSLTIPAQILQCPQPYLHRLSTVSSTIPSQILQCPQPYLHRFYSVLNHTFTGSTVSSTLPSQVIRGDVGALLQIAVHKLATM